MLLPNYFRQNENQNDGRNTLLLLWVGFLSSATGTVACFFARGRKAYPGGLTGGLTVGLEGDERFCHLRRLLTSVTRTGRLQSASVCTAYIVLLGIVLQSLSVFPNLFVGGEPPRSTTRRAGALSLVLPGWLRLPQDEPGIDLYLDRPFTSTQRVPHLGGNMNPFLRGTLEGGTLEPRAGKLSLEGVRFAPERRNVPSWSLLLVR